MSKKALINEIVEAMINIVRISPEPAAVDDNGNKIEDIPKRNTVVIIFKPERARFFEFLSAMLKK